MIEDVLGIFISVESFQLVGFDTALAAAGVGGHGRNEDGFDVGVSGEGDGGFLIGENAGIFMIIGAGASPILHMVVEIERRKQGLMVRVIGIKCGVVGMSRRDAGEDDGKVFTAESAVGGLIYLLENVSEITQQIIVTVDLPGGLGGQISQSRKVTSGNANLLNLRH